MWDAGVLAAAVCVRLGADVAGQVTLAMLVAYAWEYEKAALWPNVSDHPVVADLSLLVTGLLTGMLGVLAWPRGEIDQQFVIQAAAILSPVGVGVMMYGPASCFVAAARSRPRCWPFTPSRFSRSASRWSEPRC